MSSVLPQQILNELGTTVVFGLGYYLFKSIQNKLSSKTQTNQITKPQYTPKEQDNDSDSEPDDDDWNLDDNEPQLNKAEIGLRNIKHKLEGALAQYEYESTIHNHEYTLINEYNINVSNVHNEPHNIIKQLHTKGIVPGIDTYNYLIHSCYVNENYDKAYELIDEVMDYTGPVSPNVYTLNIIITGLSLEYKNNIREFDTEVNKYIQMFLSNGIEKDITTDNVLIKCLVNMERYIEAWEYYSNIKNSDLHIITTLLNGIKHMNKLYYSETWLKRILYLIKETKYSYNIDADFFNTIASQCLIYNSISELFEMFQMYKDKIQFTAHSLSLVIQAYSKQYKFNKAFEIFESCTNKNEEIYTSILTCAIRAKCYKQALDIYNNINDTEIKHSSSLCLIAIQIYKEFHLYDKVIYDIYYNIIKQNIIQFDKDNQHIMNNILDCACQMNSLSLLNEIFSYMKSNPKIICDSSTYLIMIESYCLHNDIFSLTEIINEMKMNNISIDEILYYKIMTCFSKNNKRNEIIELFTEMKQRNIIIPSEIYSIIIDIYIRDNHCNKTYELFNECVQNDQQLSEQTYMQIIHLQLKYKYIDRAITIFRHLNIKHIEINNLIYNEIIKACIEYKMIRTASEFAINALEDNVSIDRDIYEELPYLIENAENDDIKEYEKKKIANKILLLLQREVCEYQYDLKMIDKYRTLVCGVQPQSYNNYYEREVNRGRRGKDSGYRRRDVNGSYNSNQEESSLYDVVANKEGDGNKKKKKKNKKKKYKDVNGNNQQLHMHNSHYENGNHFNSRDVYTEEEVSIYA